MKNFAFRSIGATAAGRISTSVAPRYVATTVSRLGAPARRHDSPNASPRVSILREDDSDSCVSSRSSLDSASPSKIAYIASPSSPRVATTLPGGCVSTRAPSRSITSICVRSSDANTSERDNTSSATRDDSPNANRERRTPSSDAAAPPKPPPLLDRSPRAIHRNTDSADRSWSASVVRVHSRASKPSPSSSSSASPPSSSSAFLPREIARNRENSSATAGLLAATVSSPLLCTSRTHASAVARRDASRLAPTSSDASPKESPRAYVAVVASSPPAASPEAPGRFTNASNAPPRTTYAAAPG